MKVEKFKEKMMSALEDKKEFICHPDIPAEMAEKDEAHFTACGEDDRDTFLVIIKKIKW